MLKLFLLTISVFILSTASVGQANGKVHLLSYKVWKQKKVDEAKSNVEELKREVKKIQRSKSEEEMLTNSQATLQKQLIQAQLNLDIIKTLSANDYFVLYVVTQFGDNPEAFRQASKHLSSKDVADILHAYEKRLQAPVEIGAQTPLKTESPAL